MTAFWPLGIDGYFRSPLKGRKDRLLIVSPFVDKRGLKDLAEGADDSVLVSRLDSLVSLEDRSLSPFSFVFYVNPDSAPEDTAEEAAETEKATESEEVLTGLHAKLFVADAGHEARIWTGSANATYAAFNQNVEFLVELTGRKKNKQNPCGIDSLITGEGFRKLLVPYTPPSTVAEESARLKLERRLDELRLLVAGSRLKVSVTPLEDRRYQLRLIRTLPDTYKSADDIEMKCWPITDHESAAKHFNRDGAEAAVFDWLTMERITSFIAFALTVKEVEPAVTIRFALNLPLENAPSDTDRQSFLLRQIIQNSGQLTRLLRFLLAEHENDAGILLTGTMGVGAETWPESAKTEEPLLELLLRALDQDPAKLVEIARLFQDLGTDGKAPLPSEFDKIWKPIWEVCQKRRRPR